MNNLSAILTGSIFVAIDIWVLWSLSSIIYTGFDLSYHNPANWAPWAQDAAFVLWALLSVLWACVVRISDDASCQSPSE